MLYHHPFTTTILIFCHCYDVDFEPQELHGHGAKGPEEQHLLSTDGAVVQVGHRHWWRPRGPRGVDLHSMLMYHLPFTNQNYIRIKICLSFIFMILNCDIILYLYTYNYIFYILSYHINIMECKGSISLRVLADCPVASHGQGHVAWVETTASKATEKPFTSGIPAFCSMSKAQPAQEKGGPKGCSFGASRTNEDEFGLVVSPAFHISQNESSFPRLTLHRSLSWSPSTCRLWSGTRCLHTAEKRDLKL